MAWPLSPNQAFYEISLIASLVQVALFFAELAMYPSSLSRVDESDR